MYHTSSKNSKEDSMAEAEWTRGKVIGDEFWKVTEETECKDFGFYSKWDGKFLKDFDQKIT